MFILNLNAYGTFLFNFCNFILNFFNIIYPMKSASVVNALNLRPQFFKEAWHINISHHTGNKGTGSCVVVRIPANSM